MGPELFAAFCEEFVVETNRLHAAQSGSTAPTEAQLEKVKATSGRWNRRSWTAFRRPACASGCTSLKLGGSS